MEPDLETWLSLWNAEEREILAGLARHDGWDWVRDNAFLILEQARFIGDLDAEIPN